MQYKEYIPALGYTPLTPLYDAGIRVTMRETTFKRRLLEQANVQSQMNMLDVGCGTGTLTIRAKQTQPEATVIGLDGDAAILARAQHKAAYDGYDVTFTQAMSFALPYPDNSFDRVLSSLMFHHLTSENKHRTLAEIWRVLRPGGELHIADWGKAQNMAMRAAFLLVQSLDGFHTTADSVAGKLPEDIAAAGFEQVHLTAQFATLFGTLALYQARKKRAELHAQRHAVTLTEEKETLLIPLYAKAADSWRVHPILGDQVAARICAHIDYDFSTLDIPRMALSVVPLRAKKLDRVVRKYLAHHPNPVVLHVACGLDSRAERVHAQRAHWYDLDYPDVITLRRLFYEEHDRYHMVSSSVLDFDWIDAVPHDRLTLIVAEGLLMYMQPSKVKALVLKLREHFPGSQFVCDVFGSLSAKVAPYTKAIKKTGAEVGFWIDDAREIEQWGEGIRLLEEWFFSQSEDVQRLPMMERVVFKTMGAFRGLRQAHRIVHYQL